MSLGEIMMKPTAILYRNLLSMQTGELLRSNPIDGAVLLGGCDKTTLALITGTISKDLPFIYVPAGFMLHGPRHPRLHDNRTRMVPGRAVGPCLRIKRLRLPSTSGALS
jgi:dihydroxyacid dehydratase/phosphogluconate dehydratase